MKSLQTAVVGAVSAVLGAHYAGLIDLGISSVFRDETERFSCRPFLPNLFAQSPPQADHLDIQKASNRLGHALTKRFARGDIDSLSVAVVSSDGVLFEGNYGVTRGNESDSSPLVTSDSMYRIASVAKLFTVLEGHILAQKGVISWDDPVEKYLPDFKYHKDHSAPSAPAESITLFHLAAHMSGLGRDWPPGDVPNWPGSLQGAGPPPGNGLPFPDHAALFRAIEKHRLVSPPFSSFPIYSNTGIGALGLALVAANRAVNGPKEPASYAGLLQKDIFDPLGMNGSHFLATVDNKDHIVVPSLAPEVADQDFLDAMNPAGGQFSSLRDFITVTQTLLNTDHPKSLLTRHTMDKWLQSVHSFEEDDWTESGVVWEIVKARDSNKRLRKIYWKLGEMLGYHTALAIHPGTSYGVSVLMGGHYPDSAEIAYEAFEIFQPAIDKTLAERSNVLFAGNWADENDTSSASIAVFRGTLYIDSLILNGTDVLAKFGVKSRVALRSTQLSDDRHEFRLDIGIPYYNGKKHMGCYPYWAGLDLWGMRNGEALNVLSFSGEEGQRLLHVPAIALQMSRR